MFDNIKKVQYIQRKLWSSRFFLWILQKKVVTDLLTKIHYKTKLMNSKFLSLLLPVGFNLKIKTYLTHLNYSTTHSSVKLLIFSSRPLCMYTYLQVSFSHIGNTGQDIRDECRTEWHNIAKRPMLSGWTVQFHGLNKESRACELKLLLLLVRVWGVVARLCWWVGKAILLWTWEGGNQ